jgi:hypothetical protein
VDRVRRDGLVEATRIVGKEVYYGLTERVKERLDYFDKNGCRNEGAGVIGDVEEEMLTTEDCGVT